MKLDFYDASDIEKIVKTNSQILGLDMIKESLAFVSKKSR
jgi:Holliday junction resolvasome RuvABC ATP-dependent DNA helicase subunit